MVERCEEARLPLEAHSPLFTLEEFLRQDLYRDLTMQAWVLRPVDLPHPARPERTQHFVRTQARPDGETQSVESLDCPARGGSAGRQSVPTTNGSESAGD